MISVHCSRRLPPHDGMRFQHTGVRPAAGGKGSMWISAVRLPDAAIAARRCH